MGKEWTIPANCGDRGCTVDHNTILHTGNIITAYGTANAGFIFTNNIAAHNEYGVMGDSSSVGNPTLDRYFPGTSIPQERDRGR